jgi:hypothetical protein
VRRIAASSGSCSAQGHVASRSRCSASASAARRFRSGSPAAQILARSASLMPRAWVQFARSSSLRWVQHARTGAGSPGISGQSVGPTLHRLALDFSVRTHRAAGAGAVESLRGVGSAGVPSGPCGVEHLLQLSPAPAAGLSPQSAHSQVSHTEQRYCEPSASEYRPSESGTGSAARLIRHRGQRPGCVGGCAEAR